MLLRNERDRAKQTLITVRPTNIAKVNGDNSRGQHKHQTND